MPNRLPSLDWLAKQRGILKTNDASYAMLDWPAPVAGPAFRSYGTECAGAYVLRLSDGGNVPTGGLGLAVWPGVQAFKRGEPPAAVLDAAALSGTADKGIRDDGMAIYDTQSRLYYTGLGWDGQLRNAKIYHSRRWAEDVVREHPDRKPVIRHISIAVTD